MNLLAGFRDHLQAAHPYVEVGRKHPDTPSNVPLCALHLTNDVEEGNTVASGDADVSGDATVHLRCVGGSADQLAFVMAALRQRMAVPAQIDGVTVLHCIFDRQQGPDPDTSIDPDPSVMTGHIWFDVWHAPDPEPGS